MTDSERGTQRRLAAIMFTDMVGYSALTQQDEAKALEVLEEHWGLVRPLVHAHRGREIKTIGDAFLVEFDSALDAVQCAIAVQTAFHDRNATAPQDRQILLRIGLHVGDVIHRDDDVYGDGVNIASRIEPVASPGGICLSEDVARQVRNKIDLPLQPLGERDLKNISVPVQLFALGLPWERPRPSPPRRAVRTKAVAFAALFALLIAAIVFWPISPSSGPPSHRIAVVPFDDLSPDRSEEYFANGITEELISTLARISRLEVIARTSAMLYRTAGLDIGTVSRELNAGTLLSGSVRRSGDRVRILVRLIDAGSGRVAWTEEYERDVRDVLAVQSDIAMRVAAALKVQLLDTERADLEVTGTGIPEAYRSLLLGRHHLHRRTSEDVRKAEQYFRQAVDLDPRYADAWTGLAECNVLYAGAGYGDIPRDRATGEARSAIMTALALQPRSADALSVLAYLQYRLDWNWSAADTSFAAAATLKPGDARIHEWRGLFLALRGRTREGVEEMRRALALDPRSPSVGTGLGRILAFDGQFEQSISQLEEVVRDHPTYAEGVFALGLSYEYAGRLDRSIATLEHAVQLSSRRPIILADLGYAYALDGRTADARTILNELDSLSKHRIVSPWTRAIVLCGLGELDQSLNLMEQSLEEREGLLVYIKAEPMLPGLRNNPRFRSIIRTLGLDP